MANSIHCPTQHGFAVLQVGPTSLDLHYMSHRPGLGSLTVGIIKGVASKLFEIPELQVELLETRSNGQTHEVGSSSCCCM
jgi:hypothetical protein